jgi:hypothetical protein
MGNHPVIATAGVAIMTIAMVSNQSIDLKMAALGIDLMAIDRMATGIIGTTPDTLSVHLTMFRVLALAHLALRHVLSTTNVL